MDPGPRPDPGVVSGPHEQDRAAAAPSGRRVEKTEPEGGEAATDTGSKDGAPPPDEYEPL